MSKVLVTESYLEDIADAIREKTGGSDTYTPGEMAAGVLAIPSGGGGGITKVEMTSILNVYLYSGGTRGWESNTTGSQGSETFYADVPVAFQNGGYILLTTERPSGNTWQFTRDRIGFTDGTEDPSNLPTGQNVGITVPPDYYLNSLSYNQDKQFTLCKVPNGKTRVYWTNTQSSYRTAGQKSYMWLITDPDLYSALGMDYYYLLRNTVPSADEAAVIANRSGT